MSPRRSWSFASAPPVPLHARIIAWIVYGFAIYGFMALVGCVGGGAMAETALQCDSLPPAASIEVFTRSQTTAACVEMLRVLDGVTAEDIAEFSKVAVVFSANGYEEDKVRIVQEIVEIIRLRGQFNKRARWYGTYDVIYRSWVAFHGIVSPKDIIVNLRAMGPEAAKEMSDEAFMTLIITIKYFRQRGYGDFATPR